jgi:hypothetical protein
MLSSRIQTIILLALVLIAAGCTGWLSSDGGQVVDPPAFDPTATLGSSLHGTAAGMEWWYNQPDGAGPLFGVQYSSTGCGTCHIPANGCNTCHDPDTNAVAQPEACIGCHGRLAKEQQLGVTDVHFTAGMVCADCHSLQQIHGDGTSYNSMFDSPNVDCISCHTSDGPGPEVPSSTSHTQHGDKLSCDACHMQSAVTCYNCHFETLLNDHEKKPAAAFKDFIVLLNDTDGHVRAGTYQAVVYQDKSFVAFGPYHGHAVSKKGRSCGDCHNNDRIDELNTTGNIAITWWDDASSQVQHTTGAIPFIPDKFTWQFVTLQDGNWVQQDTVPDQVQYKYCTPLTAEQLSALGVQ